MNERDLLDNFAIGGTAGLVLALIAFFAATYFFN
jgi:hypothetical protein